MFQKGKHWKMRRAFGAAPVPVDLVEERRLSPHPPLRVESKEGQLLLLGFCGLLLEVSKTPSREPPNERASLPQGGPALLFEPAAAAAATAAANSTAAAAAAAAAPPGLQRFRSSAAAPAATATTPAATATTPAAPAAAGTAGTAAAARLLHSLLQLMDLAELQQDGSLLLLRSRNAAHICCCCSSAESGSRDFEIVFFNVTRSQGLKAAAAAAAAADPAAAAPPQETPTGATGAAAGTAPTCAAAAAPAAAAIPTRPSNQDESDASQATVVLELLSQEQHQQQQAQRWQQQRKQLLVDVDCGDIEDLATSASAPQQQVPCSSSSSGIEGLIVKFSGPLLEAKKAFLSATDLSAQVWCERQLEWYLRTKTKKKQTFAMKEGIEQHAAIEERFHVFWPVQVEQPQDLFGFKVLNSLQQLLQLLRRGCCREVYLLVDATAAAAGSSSSSSGGDGVLLRGIVDELSLVVYSYMLKSLRQQDEQQLQQLLLRLSTAEGSDLLLPFESPLLLEALQYTQQQLQHIHCSNRYCSSTSSSNSSGTSSSNDSSEPRTLVAAMLLLLQLLQLLPPPADEMHIVYECQGEEFAREAVPFKLQNFLFSFERLLAWWKGQVPTEGIGSSEKWKCRFCDFVSVCELTPLNEEERRDAAEKLKQQQQQEEELLLLLQRQQQQQQQVQQQLEQDVQPLKQIEGQQQQQQHLDQKENEQQQQAEEDLGRLKQQQQKQQQQHAAGAKELLRPQLVDNGLVAALQVARRSSHLKSLFNQPQQQRQQNQQQNEQQQGLSSSSAPVAPFLGVRERANSLLKGDLQTAAARAAAATSAAATAAASAPAATAASAPAATAASAPAATAASAPAATAAQLLRRGWPAASLPESASLPAQKLLPPTPRKQQQPQQQKRQQRLQQQDSQSKRRAGKITDFFATQPPKLS
ncbi:hypothetical protein Esti_001156 [Eimeria stiedai]